jgi:polar amino acid transport system substrate-binding protein
LSINLIRQAAPAVKPSTLSTFLPVRRALLACACAMAALGPALPARAETMRLCYERIDVPPWRNIDGGGLNFELLARVAKRLDIQLELQSLSWKRCMESLRSNHVHGAFAVSFKPDRLAYGVYPGMGPNGAGVPDQAARMSVDRYVLVKRRGNPLEWDGKAITRLSGAIGAQPEYSIGTQLRDLGVPVDDGSQNLRELLLKLAAGRLAGAAILGSANTIFNVKNPQLAAQLETLPLPLVEKSYYLVLSHGFVASQPEQAARFWKAIDAVRKSPEYRKLEQDALAGLPPRPLPDKP